MLKDRNYKIHSSCSEELSCPQSSIKIPEKSVSLFYCLVLSPFLSVSSDGYRKIFKFEHLNINRYASFFFWLVTDSELDIDNQMPILFFHQHVDAHTYFLWYWKVKAQGQPNFFTKETQNVLFLPESLQNCFSIFRIHKFWPKHSWLCFCMHPCTFV